MSISLRPRLLAAAISLCFTAPAALAQVAQELNPVTITGARFEADPSLAPIGATVITADEIRRAGAGDVNAAIRKIGGVYGRQSLTGSPDFGLDLRGFGANSAQNMVIVVDGVRLSENEQANAILSTIPIDSVERIEITRGGASVLYGDGATGGVINIVTKRPNQRAGSGSVFVEGGSFNAGEARATAEPARLALANGDVVQHRLQLFLGRQRAQVHARGHAVADLELGNTGQQLVGKGRLHTGHHQDAAGARAGLAGERKAALDCQVHRRV